jgi:hypothetical protein
MMPKRAALVGLVFVVIAFFYLGVQLIAGVPADFAGFTMLLALGAATSLMAYVLFAGLQQS